MKRYAKLLTDGGYKGEGVLQVGDVAEILQEKGSTFALKQPSECANSSLNYFKDSEAVEIFKDHPDHPEHIKMFKEMKIRVNNPVHSKEIQRILFDMRNGWAIREKCFQHTAESGLTTWADGSICYTDDMEHFYNGVDNPEYTLKDGKLVPVEDVAQQESVEKDYIELTVKVMKKYIPDWATHVTVEGSGVYAHEEQPLYSDFADSGTSSEGRFVDLMGKFEPTIIKLDKPAPTFEQMSEKYKKGEIGKDELIKFLNGVVE